MTQHTTDTAVLADIGRLVEEEKRLWAQNSVSDADRDRLTKIGIELDRCWDLLRQRRGLREFGRDPDQAEIRPAKTVENYRNN
ncbi:MAG: DUF2630 family protein [Proteobacteria bacterium]|nr:DUF2630 family protein [Pseudomonadota bacterium]